MDFDLLSTCVFCASSLFVTDLTAPPGFSGELSAGYATLQRRMVERTSGDESDVTMKAVGAGFRWARLARDGWGAGTPASEVRLRFVFPNAHTEGQEREFIPGRIISTGDGRYENYSFLGRWAVSERFSIEGAYQQRRLRNTDLVNFGLPKLEFTEQRQLTSENVEYGLGLRLRGKGFEAGARWQHYSLVGKFNTANSGIVAQGGLDGANVDVRWKPGRLTVGLLAQGASKTVPVGGQFAPNFEDVTTTGRMSVRAVRMDVSYAFSRVDAFLALAYERTRMPVVTVAPLGFETRAFDGGSFPDSDSEDYHAETALQFSLAPGLRVRVFFRMSKGYETVTLTDAFGTRPSQAVKVERRLYFPFLLGASAEFSLGGR